MTIRRRLILAAIIIITIALDQGTKLLVRRTLMNAYPVKRGVLTLLHTENPGAFLSLGAELPPNVRHLIFDGLVSIGLLIAAFVLFTGRMQPGPDDVAIALIIGGGIGNLIDRFRLGGRVTDFIYLQAGLLHTGVFNVADMAITGGVLWLALSWMFRKKAA
ncbi:MAG: signal peptidase [Thermoanaerobaculia bacterium]|jgi:signal peptidase II|nr:signal peptidase [Thermoanaerobaculia bacterium]MEA2413896.1 signal peptidase [Thermoanaerobaculia bacterium]